MRMLFLTLFLAACGSVNLSSLVQLSQLDPLTADPETFVIAVVLPQGMDLPANSAILEFSWQSETELFGGENTLQRRSDLAGNPVPMTPDNRIFFFDLAEDALSEIRQTQRAAADQQAAGIDGVGTLAIHASPCIISDLQASEPRISTYLSIDSGVTFLPVLQHFNLNDLATETDTNGLWRCE